MMRFLDQFGGSVNQQWLEIYKQSQNWKNGSFQNLENTKVAGKILDLPKIIFKQLTRTKGREPKQPLPVMDFDKSAFIAPSDKSRFIWYGHSAILMRMSGKTLLIDPMLGPDTTPIAPKATKRFSENTIDFIDAFPEIDLLLMTHDHYDHLDFASIKKLKNKTKKYYVSLGVKRHLIKWGVKASLITEFDWWQTKNFSDIKITFSPTRHFSGRGINDRAKTLWGGWVFNTAYENIWFSGDGGYGKHFKEIGKRLGPFDFAFMECGQYNDDWHQVHLFPTEAIQAAADANAKKVMPVHWGGFALSYHHKWKDPPSDFIAAAKKKEMDFLLPRLGELFSVNSVIQDPWWDEFE